MSSSILNRVFDAVFVINLDRAPDRLKKIDEELRRRGVQYERIVAVDGKALSPKQIRASTTWSCGKFCTKGAIGCALSHRKVWETMITRGLDRVLVLEDDAHFGEDFDQRFARAWGNVPNDWDLVYIGCTTGCGERSEYSIVDWCMTGAYMATALVKDGKLPRLKTKINNHIAIPDSASATHAYALTRKAATTLLSRLGKVKGIGHIDQLITYHIGRDLRKYAFVDGTLITQSLGFGDSLIGSAGSPYLGNHLLDMIKLNRRGIRGGWMLSEPIIRLGDVQIAGWQFVFFALGWIFGIKNAKWFGLALVVDSMLLGNGKKIDWKALIFNVFLFTIGGVLRRYSKT